MINNTVNEIKKQEPMDSTAEKLQWFQASNESAYPLSTVPIMMLF
jgi:hypothetical protein